MKINLICHYFPPEIGAPQARLSEMAKAWEEQGHDVQVFTAFPNHPTGIIPAEYKGKFFQTDTWDGLTVFRHWVYATPNKGFLKKILGHLSFMFSLFFLSLFRGPRPDVIVVSSPTFFSVITAYVISLVRRAPLVFEVRDLWPGIFIELGVLKNKLIIFILESIELFLYHRAAKVVVVTKGFKEDLMKRGIPGDKIHVVTNGVNLSFFEFRPEYEEQMNKIRGDNGLEGKFVSLYIGAHGISHGLSVFVQVAKQLRDVSEKFHFLFVGEGAEKEKIMNLAKEAGLSNMTFLPGIKREQVPLYYYLCDVCLVPLRNIEGFKTFIPSKMFEMMACRKPILASLEGEAAEILSQSKGAHIVSPENQLEISKGLQDLFERESLSLQKMGEQGYHFVRENYDRDKLARDYLGIMSQINESS